MAAYVFVAAKGSPGVTVTAAAIAAVTARNPGSLLVELDPAGGDVQMLTGGSALEGLVEAAGRLRRETSRTAVTENVAEMPPGVVTLSAPTVGSTADSVIRSVGTRWMPSLTACAPVVAVDAGRWQSTQRSAERIVGADAVVVVCRPTQESIEHTRHLVASLRRQMGLPLGAVVVGDRPYPPETVSAYLGVPLIGSLAWDPRAVLALWEGGARSRWLHGRLVRSAEGAAHGLGSMAGTAPLAAVPGAGAEGDGGPGSDTGAGGTDLAVRGAAAGATSSGAVPPRLARAIRAATANMRRGRSRFAPVARTPAGDPASHVAEVDDGRTV